jgi:hypothetical protein
MELDHWSRISKSIQFKIDLFDGKFNEDDDVGMEDSDSRPETMKQGGSFKSGHIFLGAVQKRCSLKQIADAHPDDPAFTRFQHKFRQFIQDNFFSKFSDADMDMMVEPNSMVRIPILIICSNSKYILLLPINRYLSIASSRSRSCPRSLGRMKPISYAAIQISITSPDMTMSSLLHQMV